MLRATNAEQDDQWHSLPPAVRALLESVDSRRGEDGQPWLPEKIEVRFWGYEYAPDPSIDWPKTWPDLTAADTRQSSGMYRVFLPSDQLGALQDFLKTRRDRGAILIDGKKMAAAYRLPLPGEAVWRGER
jgi:hypothetical protein